jgi:hypothetical protein
MVYMVRRGLCGINREVSILRRLTVFFVTLLYVFLIASRSQSQTVAVPPQSVLGEARRVAQLLGRVLFPPPAEAVKDVDRRTGNPVWNLEWMLPQPETGTVVIRVDENTGKAVRYSDSSVGLAARQAFQSGEGISVTESQASTIVENLLAVLPLNPGDWRTEKAQLRSYEYNGQPGESLWDVTKRRYVEGRFVRLCRFSVSINPYNGKIYDWHLSDSALLSSPVGPLLTASQVQPAAVSAFIQYMGSALRPEDTTAPASNSGESGYWCWLSDTSLVCRIAHSFWFVLPEIADPNYEPGVSEPEDFQGRHKTYVSVIVDAETGEVLSIGSPVGGGGIGPNQFRFSPRVTLLHTLLKDRNAQPLALAVAGGKPTQAVAPSTQARRFMHRVGEGDLLCAQRGGPPPDMGDGTRQVVRNRDYARTGSGCGEVSRDGQIAALSPRRITREWDQRWARSLTHLVQ